MQSSSSFFWGGQPAIFMVLTDTFLVFSPESKPGMNMPVSVRLMLSMKKRIWLVVSCLMQANRVLLQ